MIRRRLSNIASILSLLLCVVSLLLWSLSWAHMSITIYRIDSATTIAAWHGDVRKWMRYTLPPYGNAFMHTFWRFPIWIIATAFAVLPGFHHYRNWSVTRKHRTARIAARRGECICGYDLTGNASGVCPECGLAVSDRG